jgi:4-aminobutyrate aminotransferase
LGIVNRETAAPDVEELPGSRARQRVDYHASVAAETTYVYDFVWDVTEPATGPFCTDADGNVLLDFTGQVGAAPLGYNHPDLRERLAAFDLPDPGKIAGQDFYMTAGDPGDPDVPGPAELMDLLTEVTAHYGMDTVFLSNSGAEAVENALKLCYDATGGEYAITFDGAFHGRTLGALSLNRSKAKYRRGFPEISGVHDVPYCRDSGCTAATCECGFFAGGTSRLRQMLDPETGHVDPDAVAYLILEPVQGEGGYHVPSDAFAADLAAVCDRHDLLVVADEIQSGMGRTGEWWGVDHLPVEPDVVCAAKAARVGATVAPRELFPDERGRISSTWGAGDIVAAAQGALTIEVIRDRNLLENATERGRHAMEALADAAPPNVVDRRGRGLMLAVEFDTEDRRDAVQAQALQRGLLTLGCGQKSLRLLPPLDVRPREIDMGVELLTDAAQAAA